MYRDSSGIRDMWGLTEKGIELIKNTPEESFDIISPQAEKILLHVAGCYIEKQAGWAGDMLRRIMSGVIVLEGIKVTKAIKRKENEYGSDIHWAVTAWMGEAEACARDMKKTVGAVFSILAVGIDMGLNCPDGGVGGGIRWGETPREKVFAILKEFLEYLYAYTGSAASFKEEVLPVVENTRWNIPELEKFIRDFIAEKESAASSALAATAAAHAEMIPADNAQDDNDIQAILEDMQSKFAAAGVSGQLAEAVTRNIWKAVNLLEQRTVEVYLPGTLIVDETIERALRGINRERDKIVVRRYDDSNLVTVLSNRSPGAESIIVSTSEAASAGIWAALTEEENAAHFRGVRLINVRMPETYLSQEQRTAYQARMLTMAVLARLLRTGEDATPIVEALLREMLENNIDLSSAELDAFIDKLGAPDSADVDASSIIARISYFLDAKKAVKLIESLKEQWLITREFWTFA